MNKRNFVTFKSNHFVNKDKDIIDAGVFGGKTLSEYLATQLKDNGFETEPPDLDDFAWTFYCKVNNLNFWIHVGEYSNANDPDGWLVVINSTLSFIKRAFGQTDEEEMSKMCKAIHHILSQNQKITQIMWHSEQEFNQSDESGTPTPS